MAWNRQTASAARSTRGAEPRRRPPRSRSLRELRRECRPAARPLRGAEQLRELRALVTRSASMSMPLARSRSHGRAPYPALEPPPRRAGEREASARSRTSCRAPARAAVVASSRPHATPTCAAVSPVSDIHQVDVRSTNVHEVRQRPHVAVHARALQRNGARQFLGSAAAAPGRRRRSLPSRPRVAATRRCRRRLVSRASPRPIVGGAGPFAGTS